MSRSTSLVAAVALATLTLSPSLADARAGGGFSAGSRGGRTYSAPAPTQTAPSYTAPMQRSVTPPSYGGAPYTAPSYGRSGFASGLLGGLLGAGIGGMLFGHGLFGGGGFGFIGFLLQLAIVFFIGRFLFRMFFRRPALAGVGGNSFGRMGQPAPGMMGGGGLGGGRSPTPVQITPADYQAFEQILQEVQASWSAQDLRRLQSTATPEMVGYFNEQLGDLARKGLRNAVTSVHLDKGDLSESWSENNAEFATVAMRFSMIDVTTDSTGRVVEGDPAQRSTATEVWTFVRSAGRQWQLSAIQQAR